MAKFCTNCGKELKDGKCDCVKTKESSVITSDLFEKCKEVVKGLFNKPLTPIKENTNEGNFNFGLIALVIASIMTGLFSYFLLDNLSSFSVLGFRLIKISFIKTFITSFIFAAIWYAILGCTIYLLATKLFKLNINVKEVFTFIGILSIYLILAFIVSIILIFVSVKLMALVMLIVSLIYSVYFIVGLMEVTNIDKDKIAYLYIPSILITAFIVYYVLPRLLSL